MTDMWKDVVQIMELTVSNQKQIQKQKRCTVQTQAASKAQFKAISKMLQNTDTFKAYLN